MLEIKVAKQADGQILIALKGRLDTQTYEQLEQRIQPLLTARRVLVFDLAQLEYLSSLGLRVLMKTNKALTALQGKFILMRLQAPIRAVIDIANALPSENIFASVEEADNYLDVMQKRAREEAGPGGGTQLT